MKHIIKLSFVMIAALAISSCSLFNVEVDSDLEGTLDVYVPEDMSKAAMDFYPFHAEKLIDAYDNTEVADYNKNIQSVSVNEIAASIERIDKGGVVLSDATVFWIVLDGKTDTVWWSNEGDWYIDDETKIYFDDLGGSFAKAADILDHAVEDNGENKFWIGVDGGSSKSGVSMDIKVTFSATFEASIL